MGYSTRQWDGGVNAWNAYIWDEKFPWQTAAPPSGGGGDPIGGGTCVAPETPILLSDGREVPAWTVSPGMSVVTRHESSLSPVYDAYRVIGAQLVKDVPRSLVILEDDRRILATPTHRFMTRLGWCEVDRLSEGDVIEGPIPGVVKVVVPSDEGPVVKLTVEDARTYVSAGLLSHNVKIR
jgi:hypothetical protein